MAPPTATSNSYQIIGQFTGTDNSIAGSPFLLPPVFNYGKDLILRISYVYGKTATVTTPSNTNCTITAPSGSVDGTINKDFSLIWLSGPGGAPTNPPAGALESSLIAQVTIKADTIWKGAATARQQLKSSFAAFCAQLEALELTSGCLSPGGAFAIAQRVVESLPLSLDETLYFRYGLDAINRFIDIQPGMRLRIEYAASQFVSPTLPASQLNGYVGNGTSYYDVSRVTDSSGNQRIAFNEFLGAIAPSITTQDTGGAGSLIDLQASGNSRRYCRLCYPPQLTSSAATGNAGITQNVTLIGADSLSDLTKATTAYVGAGNKITTDGSRPVLYTFFRGRATIIPEILIQINGQPVYVPVGTTVRNLIDRYFNYSFLVRAINPGTSDGSFTFKRAWTRNAEYIKYYPMQFQALAKDAFPAALDIYDMPVVKGDALAFAASLV